jgi:hypothetical protein
LIDKTSSIYLYVKLNRIIFRLIPRI